MNAGRDVERLLSGWLADEAAVRAPDRVLEAARLSIDRMPQRRFVAWREPVYISPLRLAGMAAVLIVGVIGGAVIGRATVPSGAGAVPSPTPTLQPTPTEDPDAAYRAYTDARDEICDRYVGETDPLRPQFENLYDPAESAADRAPKIAALAAFATKYDAMIAELGALDAPAVVAIEHATNVARFDAEAGLIDGIVERLNAGDLAGAESLDQATDPISSDIGAFEAQRGLHACP
jgi:hypothetical protein